MPTANPVVSKLLLGIAVRDLREAAQGVRREDLARVLGCDLSKISRIENGKGSLTALEVDALGRLFALGPDQLEQLRGLARDSRRRSTYRVSDWAMKFAGLEQAADAVRTYETELVPGLLQHPDYTRAVTLAADPTRPPAEVDRLVAGRAERQAVLTGDDPPHLIAVINEAVIRRPVGGATAMAAQLGRLVELTELPNVEVHVLPFAVGAHPAMGSSFVVLELPDPFDVRIVYLEDLTTAHYLDHPAQVAGYSLTFERLLGSALGPAETVGLINRVRRELT